MPVLARLLSALLIFGAGSSYAQRAYTVKIFQYEGTDSLHKELALTRRFNAQGKLVAQLCHRRYEEDYTGYEEADARYWVYQDTLLVRTYGILSNNDSVDNYFTYNTDGRCTSAEYFRYARRLKPGVDKGLGRPGGCIVLPEDYEPNRVWRQVFATTSQYDKHGRRTDQTEWRDSVVTQREHWTYDRQGRPTVYTQTRGDAALDTERYWWYNWRGKLAQLQESYWRGSYNTTTFYEYDWRGRLSEEHAYADKDSSIVAENYYTYRPRLRLETGRFTSYPGDTSLQERDRVYVLSSKGLVIEEMDFAGHCPLETKKLIRYYPDGRVAQTVLFTCRDSRRVVHDYVYE